MLDSVIRGGTIVDGTGRPGFTGDIGISDGRIVEIGRVSGAARETIDADGAIVTPGFVDVHTHYDGQFLWDDRIDPSFSHGVTTAIGGNCGVGFAPVRPEHRRPLIELMEGVEEIPGIVLDEGLDWNWRSFPDYLDRLAARSYAMDIASHITHAPLRVFVMGERALRHEVATDEDVAEMAKLVREAMDSGAIGFSAGRLVEHRSSAGAHVPGTFAEDNELFAIARAMGEAGHGTFQIIPAGGIGDILGGDLGPAGRKAEHDRIVAIARACGRPVTYSLTEFESDPGDMAAMVAESDRAGEMGVVVRPQTASRGVGTLMMLEGHHPFLLRPSYRAIAELPLAARAAAMRDPDRRRAILSEADDAGEAARDPVYHGLVQRLGKRAGESFALTLPIDYEPGPDQRIAVLAARAGETPLAYLYDHLARGDGGNVAAAYALNYLHGDLEPTYRMLSNDNVVSGLGDGGAHMKLICDASMPTTQLTFWTRDRRRGPTLPVELIVRKLTSDGADLYGLSDRGRIALGKRADLNVIDYDGLQVGMPYMAHDLPHGSPRVLQGSRGYLATMVAGSVTRRNDADTGARPGRLVRSRRAH